MPALTSVALALLLIACTQPPKPEPRSDLAITLRATTPGAEPVAEVRAWADARELGVTRGNGELSARLSGRDGQRVVLSFACPATHRTLDPHRELLLRGARPIAGHSATALVVAVRCEPIEHLAALVVRARGPRVAGLPVRVQGEPAATIAPDGTAHLLVPVRAGEPLRVMLDTSGDPALRPANPAQTFELRDQDRVLLFAQHFSLTRHRPPAPAPLGPRPYRID